MEAETGHAIFQDYPEYICVFCLVLAAIYAFANLYFAQL